MNKVRELRQKMGLTQKELASSINISQSALSTYETGRINIDNDTLVKLARFFNVTIDELLGNNSEHLNHTIQSMSNIEYALSGELRNLTENEMKDILDYVRFKKAQRNRGK